MEAKGTTVAKLIQLGEVVTRGERKTLDYLQQTLPDDWVIFGNAQITTGELTREVDAIIIGERRGAPSLTMWSLVAPYCGVRSGALSLRLPCLPPASLT